MLTFAHELELPISFSPVCPSDCFIDSEQTKQQLMPRCDQLQELRTFWYNPRYSLQLMHVAFWQDYFRIIQGEKRRIPCALVYHALFLDADGTLFICAVDPSLVYGNVHNAPVDKIWYSDEAEKTRKRAKRLFCPLCTSSCNAPFSFGQEFFYFARFLMKEESKRFLRHLGRGMVNRSIN